MPQLYPQLGGKGMKSVLDKSFRYTKSLETDVGATFKRIRREQERAKREAEELQRQVDEKVKQIGFRK
jgi:hypothetical protein